MKLRYLRNVVSLRLDTGSCIGCGRCVEVCPHAVFIISGGKSEIAERDACMECGACALNCPGEALEVDRGVGCAVGLLNLALGREGACCAETKACCGGGPESPGAAIKETKSTSGLGKRDNRGHGWDPTGT